MSKYMDDTITPSGEAYIIDLLSEGEIKGLVSGKNSIFLDENPLEDLDGSTDFPVPRDFFNEAIHFHKGTPEQPVFPPPFHKTKITIPVPESNLVKRGQPVSVSFNSNTYPDAVSAIVNVRVPALFRQYVKGETGYGPEGFEKHIDGVDPWSDLALYDLIIKRYPDGYPTQNEIPINQRLKAKKLRQVGGLWYAMRGAKIDKGDIVANRLHYVIELSHNNGPFEEAADIKLVEKSSQGFINSTEIALPIDPSKNIQKYKIRVKRLTIDENVLQVKGEMYLDAVTVTINSSFKYPNSSLCALKLDAEKFRSIPKREYLCDLLKIKVPSNYEPPVFNRDGKMISPPSYNGAWDGTFKTEWSNNPAWVFYDVLTNKRYGLGEFIESFKVDKWSLYAIGQYCDAINPITGDFEGVSDGQGGLEQRFSCNVIITETEDAYTLINHLASVFRGITYWSSGLIFGVQDRPRPKDSNTQLFTNANVIEGRFDYSTSEKNKRRTVAKVKWNDPEDFYRNKIEYVEDPEGIIKQGIKETEIAAFACTSRSQAHRVGKWVLLTERLESEIVKFKVGFEGLYTRPGDIVEIYDDFRALQMLGGRVKYMPDESTIVLDRKIEQKYSPSNYKISITYPTSNREPYLTDPVYGVTDSSQISGIRTSHIEEREVSNIYTTGDLYTVIETTNPFPYKADINNSWVVSPEIDRHTISGVKEYRIINLVESEEDRSIEVTALEYNSGKFQMVEEDFSTLESPNIDYAISGISPPSNIQFTTINEPTYSKIQVSFLPSPGPNLLKHFASGRFIYPDTGIQERPWTSVKVDEENYTIDYIVQPNDPNLIEAEFLIGALQYGGARSTMISGRYKAEPENPFGSGTGALIPLSGILLDNGINNSPTFYEEETPAFYFVLDFTGISGASNPAPENDERFPFLGGVKWRLNDKDNNPVSRFFSVPYDQVYTIPNEGVTEGGDIFSGWRFRSGIIEAKTFDNYGNESAPKYLNIVNPPLPPADLTFGSRNKNAFSYNINPHGVVSDLSGVLFYVSSTPSKPVSPMFTGYSLAGNITHGLNSENVYVWFEMCDNFTYDGTVLNGPFSYDFGDVPIPNNFHVHAKLITDTDSRGNENNRIQFNWMPFTGDTMQGYVLEIQDSSGQSYIYSQHKQPDSQTGIYYDFTDPIPSMSYSGRVRAISIDGRESPWSNYGDTINTSYPLLRYLEVNGYSSFHNNTKVDVHFESITNSPAERTINMSTSNIIGVNLENTNTVDLIPTGIISGATYLILFKRVAGNGEVILNSGWKWQEGEQPDLPVDIDSEHVISCFATGSNVLYGVASLNFG